MSVWLVSPFSPCSADPLKEKRNILPTFSNRVSVMWMRREQDPPVGCCVCRLLLLHVWWWGGDRLQKNGQEVGSNDNAQLLICSRWPSAIPLCGETMTRTMRAGASWLPWTSNTSSATWCCSQVDRSEDKFTFWAKGWIQTLGRCSEDAVSENGSNAWQPERLWRHVNPRFRSTFYSQQLKVLSEHSSCG